MNTDPTYRFTYVIYFARTTIHGNTKARTEQEVRSILAVNYGGRLAEEATVTLAYPEDVSSE